MNKTATRFGILGAIELKRIMIGSLLIILVALTGCQAETPDDELNGTVTLWHSWSPAEATVLGETLAGFEQLHPKVRIIPVALPENQIFEEFVDAGNDGLGPDVLLGKDSWIGELADAGLIRSLQLTQADKSLFNSRNRSLTEYNGELYGVPLFLAPRALYYNKSMVTELPANLDALLEEAAEGNSIAFVPRFEEAYWGIQAFGDGLFDSQGQFKLAESGFSDWLAWISEAQRSPGVILNEDDTSLMELFASGQIAYYVAGPKKQNDITALLNMADPFEFGVIPLPSGPIGPAGPLLPAETILLYAYTSDAQTRIADSLARFLVNQQQSIRFMREIDQVPANPSVVVDRRIYPIVSGFARQADTAVVIPNEISTDPLVAAGNRAYISVLSGALTPDEAVCRFGQEVADFQGYAADDIELPEGCVPPE
jgi:maltose-binding protein MalE